MYVYFFLILTEYQLVANLFSPAHHSVDEVMQIRRITQLGSTTAVPANVASYSKVAQRPQPKGLKARFQPIGVNSDMGTIGLGDDDDGDVEMEDASTPATSRKKSKKVSQPKESSKGKRKHSVSEDEAAAAAEQLMEESVSAVAKSKKQKTAARGSPDLGSELPTSKQTLIVPPPVPGSSATVEATPVKKSKTKKADKPSTPLPSSSQLSAGSKKETPVPVPFVPGLSKSAATSTPSEKKSKKRKEKATPASAPE